MHHSVTKSFQFLGFFLPAYDLHGDFVSPPPHTKWQHRVAGFVNISQIFFLELMRMRFLADPKAAEVKLIKP